MFRVSLLIIFFTLAMPSFATDWSSYACIGLGDPYHTVEDACQRYRDYKTDQSISCEPNGEPETGTFFRTIDGYTYSFSQREYFDATRDGGAGALVGSFYCYSGGIPPDPPECTSENFDFAVAEHCSGARNNSDCSESRLLTYQRPELDSSVDVGLAYSYVCSSGCLVNIINQISVVGETDSEYTLRTYEQHEVTADDCVDAPDGSDQTEPYFIAGSNESGSVPDGANSSSPDGTYSPGSDSGSGDSSEDLASIVENTAATTRNLVTIHEDFQELTQEFTDSIQSQTDSLSSLINETNSILQGLSGEPAGVSGSASDCSSPPVSTGDAQLSAIHYQLWLNHCNSNSEVSGVDDCNSPFVCENDPAICAALKIQHEQLCSMSPDSLEQDMAAEFDRRGLSPVTDVLLMDDMSVTHDAGGMVGDFLDGASASGACPPNPVIDVFGSAIEIELSPLCDLGIYIRSLVLLSASFLGLRIFFNAFLTT